MYHKSLGCIKIYKDEQKVKKCDQCETEFKIAIDFDEHLASVHKCDKDFKCKECDTNWVSHLSLELHYIESHKKIIDTILQHMMQFKKMLIRQWKKWVPNYSAFK